MHGGRGDGAAEGAGGRAGIDLVAGRMGQPPGGFPKKVCQRILGDVKPVRGRPGASLPSVDFDAVRAEILKMRELTDKPFGVNIAQLFVRDPSIADFVVDQGVRFVTTSAGDPNQYTKKLKDAGLTVFHVVPTLRAALKAVEAGVDGLVVEGGEGGGFKNPKDVASMVLIPLVCERVKVPVVAAGGIMDGRTMAAALGSSLIAEGTVCKIFPTSCFKSFR